MTVLLTGAAGFIGSRIAELLPETTAIVGVDNYNDYYDPRLKQYRIGELASDTRFTMIDADITNVGAMDALFSANRFSAVIHLAGMAGIRYSTHHPLEFEQANVQGTAVILDVMHRHRVPKIVFASSSSVYAGNTPPFRETMNIDAPTSVYAATKRSAELLIHAYHTLFGIHGVMLRYFSVFGPKGRPDMSYFRFIRKIGEGLPICIFGDGSQKRDFTYVDDIAAGTVAALGLDGLHVINLGGGASYSVNELINSVEAALGKKAVINYTNGDASDLPATCADSSEASRLLGWKPTVLFEEGITRTVRWHCLNRDFIRTLRHE